MFSDRYNTRDNGLNQNDPNYVQDQGRRNLGKDVLKVARVLASIAGTFEFVTKVVPDAADKLGNYSLDQLRSLDPTVDLSWIEHPVRTITFKTLVDPTEIQISKNMIIVRDSVFEDGTRYVDLDLFEDPHQTDQKEIFIGNSYMKMSIYKPSDKPSNCYKYLLWHLLANQPPEAREYRYEVRKKFIGREGVQKSGPIEDEGGTLAPGK